jgi:long-chain fatty acid transport protein
VALGDTLIMANVGVTGPSNTPSSDQGLSPPPHFYLRYQPKQLDWFAAGVGVFVPFGAASHWEDGWEGRFRTTGSALSVYDINPEVAVLLGNRLRVGGGIQIARATVLLSRDLDFVDSTGSVELGGATWAFGLNAGAQLDIVKGVLDAGFSWRSSLDLSVDGTAHFSNVPAEFQGLLHDQNVSTTVTTPDIIYAGIGVHPREGFRLSFDTHWFRWSSFQSLDLNFADPAISSSLAKRWEDTFSFHVGAEVDVAENFQLRGGVAYDPTPSPVDTLTPDLPDVSRTKVSLGLGYKWNGLQFDLAYQYVRLSTTTSTSPFFPATYSGSAHVVGLTIGYHTGL